MFQLLLVIIYTAFISLGFPNALLGSTWPSMYRELHAGASYVGITSMIIAGGTTVSSLLSDSLIRKLETGAVTTISVIMAVAALTGFSGSHTFLQLCLQGIPYRSGAGSADATLNDSITLHCGSRHVNWLHCFQRIDATASPHIMGFCLIDRLKWNHGYTVVGIIQIILVIYLLISLPLWKVKTDTGRGMSEEHEGMNSRDALRLPGTRGVLIAFFCYRALGAAAGLQAGSYIVFLKGVPAGTAAKWTSLLYLGITAGRLASGFVTGRLGDRTMVWIGQLTVFSGVVLSALPFDRGAALTGLVLIRLGCVPVYLSILHQTPDHFGAENSQSIMRLRMVCAYMGSTFMPPLFGLGAELISIRIYPFYLMVFICLMVMMTERVGKIHADEPDRLTHVQLLQRQRGAFSPGTGRGMPREWYRGYGHCEL